MGKRTNATRAPSPSRSLRGHRTLALAYQNHSLRGIDDGTHEIVGTTFVPGRAKKGGEGLENWLSRSLSPRPYFVFHSFDYEGKPVVLLEIPRASKHPVAFNGVEYIRIGSHKQKLKDNPAIAQELWRVFDTTPFEQLKAAENLTAARVLELLDYPSYFSLLGQEQPREEAKIIERLTDEGLIVANTAGAWDITNLGAILFAQDLNQFRSLSRKAARVVIYKGKGRLESEPEPDCSKGYAAGFDALIENANPLQEVMGPARRQTEKTFPDLALRELIANALIHQDFMISGSGPMIEIFSDRVEITNPGTPLMATERLLDMPPRSRNEALASLMRRIGICEERGSGVDKVVSQTESLHLPGPTL